MLLRPQTKPEPERLPGESSSYFRYSEGLEQLAVEA
jgi:hypothetical protein